jgi:hypothetical protein
MDLDCLECHLVSIDTGEDLSPGRFEKVTRATRFGQMQQSATETVALLLLETFFTLNLTFSDVQVDRDMSWC